MLSFIKNKILFLTLLLAWTGISATNVSGSEIEIRINGKEATFLQLEPGYTQLVEVITADDETVPKVKWFSHNDAVASVSEYGIIRGVATGITKIRVFDEDNSTHYKDIVVSVSPFLPITGIDIPMKDTTLQVYDQLLLTTNFLPADRLMPAGDRVLWDCNNWYAVDIDRNGLLTAKNEGTAVITALYDYYGTIMKDQITVNIYLGTIPVRELKVDNTKISVIKGRSYTFNVMVLPEKANNHRVTVSSANTGIARVEHNRYIYSENAFTITGVKPGTTTLTAVAEDGNHTVEIEVTVEENTTRGGGFLAQGVTPESGWFDCNKEWGSRDSTVVNGEWVDYLRSDNGMCWGATAANLIDWWQASIGHDNVPENAPHGATKDNDGNLKPSDNSSFSQSNVYEYFRLYSANQGYFVEKGLNWYFTGAESLASTVHWDKGFRYKEYEGFEKNRHVASCVDFFMDKGRAFYIREFKKTLENTIGKGTPAGLNINYPGGYGHAVTLWGYELADYDFVETGECPNSDLENSKVTSEKLNARNGDHLVAYVYITDSDDGYSPNTRPQSVKRPWSLIRVPVFYRDQGLYVVTAGSCNSFGRIISISAFSLKYGDVPKLK
ncbi:MAG: Ig-like domain-containing protein [Bacteroidales bacterium]